MLYSITSSASSSSPMVTLAPQTDRRYSCSADADFACRRAISFQPVQSGNLSRLPNGSLQRRHRSRMKFGVVRQTNSTYRRCRIRRAALGPEQHARCTAVRSCSFEREPTWAMFGCGLPRGRERLHSAFPNCLGSTRGGKKFDQSFGTPRELRPSSPTRRAVGKLR
jgi:hypothetical protein